VGDSRLGRGHLGTAGLAIVLAGAAGLSCRAHHSAGAAPDPAASAVSSNAIPGGDNPCEQLAACCIRVGDTSPLSASNCTTGAQSGTPSLCRSLLDDFHGAHFCP
jgi:hypothetical protein